MKALKYIEEKNYLCNAILNFIESENNENEDLQSIIEIFQNKKVVENRDEFKFILHVISKISSNHFRNKFFFNKFEQIIHYFETDIKQFFSNIEIYNIFKGNKRILLFLFLNKIIIPEKSIIGIMNYEDKKKMTNNCFYFYPEIKDILSKQDQNRIETEMLDIDSNIFDNFEEKRKIGENDSYICSLIRNDSVEDFIIYVNQKNLSLSKTTIKPSIFETNSFLIKIAPTLIQYTAFFGSIQIFNYLRLSGAELSRNLWYYIIHSNNGELIHLLESIPIYPPKYSYLLCLLESIKCHHNDLAIYIQDYLYDKKNEYNIKLDDIKKVLPYSFRYYNFKFMPKKLNDKNLFNFLCAYDYITLVKDFLSIKEYNVNKAVKILLINIFI